MANSDNSIRGILQQTPYLMLVAILLMRFFTIWLMGPMPQDAYYFFYAQHPALCYFDHPPAIAWLLRFFTGLFGKEVYIMKLADSVLTIGTTFAVYNLSKRFFPGVDSKKTVILFLSTLMVTILSLVSTPDVPLLFFWTLSLIFLHDAVFLNKRSSWLIAGILMGLAFQSKYTAIFLPFGLLLFLLLSDKKRKLLLTIGPWACLLIMTAVMSPVIIWNINNHFASFAFQGTQRMRDAAALEIKPAFVAGVVGHQLALLIPIALAAIVYAISRITKMYWRSRVRIPMEITFLLCFFLPVFLVFFLLSPIYWIKINWMMPAYVTGLILAGNMITAKWLRIQVIVSFIVHLALITEIIFYPFQVKSDDTWVGWKDLSAKIDVVAKQYNTDFIFSADSYKTTAELNLYASKFVYGQNVIGERALQFDFIGTDLSILKGKSAVYIDSDPGFKNDDKQASQPEGLSAYFSSIEQISPIIISLHGRPVRKFFAYVCRGYKPPGKFIGYNVTR